MPNSVTYRPRTTQPPDAAWPLKGSHPLAGQARLALSNAGAAYDTRRNRMLSLGTSARFRPYTRSGSGGATDPGLSVVVNLLQDFTLNSAVQTQLAYGSGLSGLVPVSSPFWIVGQVRITALGGRGTVFADFSAGGGSASVRFEQQAADTWLFGVARGGVFNSATSVVSVSSGLHSFALWQGADLVPNMIIDGGAIASASALTGDRDAGVDLRLGSAGAFSGAISLVGGVGAFIIGEGAPGELALRELARNPWALWEDEIDYTFFPKVVASGQMGARVHRMPHTARM